MKKVESVFNGFLGCGNSRPLATFPQIFFGLPSFIIHKKYTFGGILGSKYTIERAFRCNSNTNLTLH